MPVALKELQLKCHAQDAIDALLEQLSIGEILQLIEGSLPEMDMEVRTLLHRWRIEWDQVTR